MKRVLFTLMVLACGACGASSSPPPATEPAGPPGTLDAGSPAAPASAATPNPDAGAEEKASAEPDAGTGSGSNANADAAAATADDAVSSAGDAGSSYDMSVVFSVFKAHKDDLRAACWEHAKSTEKAYLGKAHIRVAPTGKVLSSKTEGTDEAASACVDKQIKKWKFPPPNGNADIVLPVHMHRD
jgi:hypothetical protein